MTQSIVSRHKKELSSQYTGNITSIAGYKYDSSTQQNTAFKQCKVKYNGRCKAESERRY